MRKLPKSAWIIIIVGFSLMVLYQTWRYQVCREQELSVTYCLTRR